MAIASSYCAVQLTLSLDISELTEVNIRERGSFRPSFEKE
jgi:hypothetical protein